MPRGNPAGYSGSQMGKAFGYSGGGPSLTTGTLYGVGRQPTLGQMSRMPGEYTPAARQILRRRICSAIDWIC